MGEQNKPAGLPIPDPVDPELRKLERLQWLKELPETSKASFAPLSKREIVLYTRGSIELCACAGNPGDALTFFNKANRQLDKALNQALCKRCAGKGYFFVSRA